MLPRLVAEHNCGDMYVMIILLRLLLMLTAAVEYMQGEGSQFKLAPPSDPNAPIWTYGLLAGIMPLAAGIL